VIEAELKFSEEDVACSLLLADIHSYNLGGCAIVSGMLQAAAAYASSPSRAYADDIFLQGSAAGMTAAFPILCDLAEP
jgi:hypothetical protein